jgi:hypothetical protein
MAAIVFIGLGARNLCQYKHLYFIGVTLSISVALVFLTYMTIYTVLSKKG